VRYYIPQEDVRMDTLVSSSTTSRCPYKGPASYWSVKIGSETFNDLVWGYMNPIPECPRSKGSFVSFTSAARHLRRWRADTAACDEMGPTAQKLTRHSANMRALYWDGRELSLSSSYPAQLLGRRSRIEIEDCRGDCQSLTADENQTALVKVHLAGVCSTDLQIFKGYMGFKGVPGTSCRFVTEGPRELIGKRVVARSILLAANAITAGAISVATVQTANVMGISRRWCVAEYVAVPVEIFTQCRKYSRRGSGVHRTLAAALKFNQIQLDPADDVLVLGDGKLGNLCAQVLRLRVRKSLRCGKHAEKLALIKKRACVRFKLKD